MGIFGMLYERLHRPDPQKASRVARAAFEYYWLLEDYKAIIFPWPHNFPDGVRVFLSCYLALNKIEADGDPGVSSEQMATAAVFLEDGSSQNIIGAATIIAAGRGHILGRMSTSELKALAEDYLNNRVPVWQREFRESGPTEAERDVRVLPGSKIYRMLSSLCGAPRGAMG